MATTQTAPASKATPLRDLHVALGARMIDFAGYEMPLNYPAGVMKEHLHTRAAAGLFDTSHMGQIVLRAKSGGFAQAALALERLVAADILALASGRQRYAYFTNAAGGLIDDLMIARRGDDLLIVCNASRKALDEAHLRAHLSDDCDIVALDRALIALQGPQAETALARLAPEVAAMRFMDARRIDILGAACFVTRSGYTGEDGFEISIPALHARTIAEALLATEGVAPAGLNVAPAGLGARDSLRLEAGLCLYGADIDETTTPIEAGLDFGVGKARRRGGAREGGFPGADIILEQLENGAPRRRVGLRPEGRAPARAGAPLFAQENDAEPAGHVVSGVFGPSADAPVAMGYLPATRAAEGTRVYCELRGKRLATQVVGLPFIQHRYNRR